MAIDWEEFERTRGAAAERLDQEHPELAYRRGVQRPRRLLRAWNSPRVRRRQPRQQAADQDVRRRSTPHWEGDHE
jgi:hypothetical protein